MHDLFFQDSKLNILQASVEKLKAFGERLGNNCKLSHRLETLVQTQEQPVCVQGHGCCSVHEVKIAKVSELVCTCVVFCLGCVHLQHYKLCKNKPNKVLKSVIQITKCHESKKYSSWHFA